MLQPEDTVHITDEDHHVFWMLERTEEPRMECVLVSLSGQEHEEYKAKCFVLSVLLTQARVSQEDGCSIEQMSKQTDLWN